MSLNLIDKKIEKGQLEKIEKIKIEKNISIEIYNQTSNNKKLIRLILEENNQTIGGLYETNYQNGSFYIDNHLFKEIHPDFRRKGFMKKLFEIYKKYEELPKIEASSKASNILFLLKNGYKLHSYITKNGKEIEEDFIETEAEIQKHLSNIKKYIKNDGFEMNTNYIYLFKLKKQTKISQN